jgi:hypothetical protein
VSVHTYFSPPMKLTKESKPVSLLKCGKTM